MIEFFVTGEPKPQPRARAYNRGPHAAVYDPGTANAWKNAIALQAKEKMPESPLEGPVSASIDFFLKRPKSKCRRKDPDGPIWCFAGRRNDRDNLDKAILDTLTDLGFWKDDGQVCDGRIRKFYHSKRGRPGAMIRIRECSDAVSNFLEGGQDVR